MTLNRVHDTINVKEGGETLRLVVNGDSLRMVAGLTKAQQKMTALNDDSSEEELTNCAEYFAAVIFGREQAEKLMAFYANDPASVINVCGRYFKERLAGKIAEVQKKIKA